MKRYVLLVALGVASIIGWTTLRNTAHAQTPPPAPQRQVAIFTIDGFKFPRAENGKATIWTAEELRKKYVTDPNGPAMDHLEWAPPYRSQCSGGALPDPATVGGEMHEDVSH